jgi:alkanesulfonate monooxygenase SsuD/methylene tetrahydromethanopterin reductase-like flavin-dependent oxidoreductase (luciferase family)
MEPGFVRPGGPPLWLGGQGPRGLRIAARYADGWYYASNLDGTLEGFRARLDGLKGACEEIGRDPTELAISTQIIIPGDAAGRRTATERAIAFGRAGSDEILLTTPAREGAAGIRRLATEVAAPLRDAFG